MDSGGTLDSVVHVDLEINKRDNRLVIHCPKKWYNKLKRATRGVITWRGPSKTWSMAPDPTALALMMHEFGDDLVFSESLQKYLSLMADKQEAVLQSVNDTTAIHPDLLPFQNASVRFMTTAVRCILGHETGVGKTPPTCVALDYVNARKVIIVCLNSLKWTWAEHLSKWGQLRNLYILEASAIRDEFDFNLIKGTIKTQKEALLPILTHDKEYTLIMNYATFRLHHQDLLKFGYDVVIADEAHRLINRKAQQTEAFFKLSKKTKYLWLLSGTPVRNNYDDLVSLLKICDSDRFSGYWNTLQLHFETVPGIFGGTEVVGLRDKETFNKMMATYMYRELKKDVYPQMPDKVYDEIRVPMHTAQRKVYDKMEKELVMAIMEETAKGTSWEELFRVPNILSQQTRLRQISLTPAILGGKNQSGKLETLRELVQTYTDEGLQVLVFTMFRKLIPYMEDIMHELDIPYAKIVGGMNVSQYKKVEEDLNNGSIQVIMGTTQAMGEGLNLQAAGVVIFMDRSWVPAENKQAEDRVHRGKIEESPLIIYLYHKDTIDEDIMAVLERKEGVERTTIGEVEIMRRMLLRRKE